MTGSTLNGDGASVGPGRNHEADHRVGNEDDRQYLVPPGCAHKEQQQNQDDADDRTDGQELMMIQPRR